MQQTFKTRVDEFWSWFSQRSNEIYQAVDAANHDWLVEQMSAAVSAIQPDLAWVFGPGADGVGHSFTVSGEGLVEKQILAEFWRQRAPELPNWTFHASRQPATAERLAAAGIQVGENEQVDVAGFQVRPSVDEERQVVDITAWHPSLDVVPKEHHPQILFLLLDDALGEFGTGNWIGEIEVKPLDKKGLFRRSGSSESEQPMTLLDLPSFISELAEQKGWTKPSPVESRTVYQVGEQSSAHRGDTAVGSTAIPNLIAELLQNGALVDDPFTAAGADLVSLQLDGSLFTPGQQADQRGAIEDALDEALSAAQSGAVLGGAIGHINSYIEMVLYDGAASRAIVESKLAELQLTERATLHPMRA